MPKNEFSCDCNVIHHDIVHNLIKQLPDHQVFDQVSLFFKVFGDSTRIKIIWALNQHELCVCDIANILNMTKSAVSHQLGTLRRAKLVTCRREGKTVFYKLSDEHVKQMFEAGMNHNHE